MTAFVDARCGCKECDKRTGDVYRQIGWCKNCGLDPVLILFRSGDAARDVDCPRCKNSWSVHPERPATDDEIPLAGPAPAEETR